MEAFCQDIPCILLVNIGADLSRQHNAQASGAGYSNMQKVVTADLDGAGDMCRIREMRQPQAGCNAPSAIITAAAQFIDIADVTPQACSTKPIDYSYSLGYHVSPSLSLSV